WRETETGTVQEQYSEDARHSLFCPVTSRDKDEIRRELQALTGLFSSGFVSQDDYTDRRRQLLRAKRHAIRRIAVAVYDWEARLRNPARESDDDEIDSEERSVVFLNQIYILIVLFLAKETHPSMIFQ